MQRDLVLVGEMISSANASIEIMGTLEAAELLMNRLRRDAILWNMSILGEASTQISDSLKSEHPEIPWRAPAQLRNRIIHGYWEVDLDIIVAVVRNDLPPLIAQLQAIEVN